MYNGFKDIKNELINLMDIIMSRGILANVKLTLQDDKKAYYCLSSIKKKGQFPKAYSYTCKSSINGYLRKNNYAVLF